MILSIISSIVTAITTIFTRYNERKEAEHKTDVAIENAKLKRVEKELENEHMLNIERLKSTGRYFKYFTFLMWFGPFMISWIFPAYGLQIFDNLKLLPEWYVQSCMAIMFAVWSISVSRDTVQTMFSSLGQFMRESRKYKLDKKALYAAIRAADAKKMLTQRQVDIIEPILNNIEQELNTD